MTLDNEMERIGKITAADQQVKVRLQGTLAYSIPGLVNLPTPDVYKHLGRYANRMIHGLLDHEIAHERDTDHRCMAAARNQKDDQLYVETRYPQVDQEWLRKLGGEALGMTLNAVEDGRIEVKHGRRYPGAAENMHRKNHWFLDSPDPRVQKPMDLWARYLLALTLVCRRSIEIDVYKAGPHVDPEVHSMLVASHKFIAALAKAETTGDALSIAIDIMREFDVESEKPEEEDEDEGGGSESDEEGESEEGEGGEEGKPTAGDDGDKSDDGGDGDEEDEDSESGEGEEEDDTDGGENNEEEQEEEDDDTESIQLQLRAWENESAALTPEDAISQIIEAVFDQPDNHQPYLVFNHDYDVEKDFSTTDLRHLSKEWDAIQKEAQPAADVLTQTFETALAARREKHPVPGYDEGEVDISLLSEFTLGAASADEIFRQDVAVDDRDTAVAIMIDCSGSMREASNPRSRSHLARLTAAAMHEALARCQIAHEISGFTTVDSDGVAQHPWCRGIEREVHDKFEKMRQGLREEQSRGADTQRYARSIRDAGLRTLRTPTYAVFKSFAQADARGLAHVTGLYENLDGEAVVWQARRLATRSEPRRIMFVLSDGLPLGSRNQTQGARYLKESVDLVTSIGIEVYGIGILSPHVQQFYPRSWVAESLDDLCAVALGGMIEVLTEARQEHEWVHLASA